MSKIIEIVLFIKDFAPFIASSVALYLGSAFYEHKKQNKLKIKKWNKRIPRLKKKAFDLYVRHEREHRPGNVANNTKFNMVGLVNSNRNNSHYKIPEPNYIITNNDSEIEFYEYLKDQKILYDYSCETLTSSSDGRIVCFAYTLDFTDNFWLDIKKDFEEQFPYLKD